MPRRAIWRAALTVAVSIAASAAAHAAGTDAAARRPAVRLGTAAAPLCCATRIGDFNADGRPDVAVVDRLATRPGETRYALEVDLAGGRVQRIEFTSIHPALAVTLADIDHDGDLDIVLTPLLSRTVAAVWVNDGSGRFDAQPVDPRSPPVLPASQLEAHERRALDAVPALFASTRIVVDAGAATRALTPSREDRGAVVMLRRSRARRPAAAPLPSRAPPAPSSLL